MVLGHDISTTIRTQDVQITEDIMFDTMMLSKKTLKGLRSAGFYKPSPIQLNGIPLGKCGFDLLLEAKSGTGKTAVFTVIALEKINLNQGVQIVILAPTREIAAQISDVITQIGVAYTGLNIAVVMGGIPVQEDRIKLKENVHIVVGSPGRMRHLVHEKVIDLSSVRLFVLDEADKLLEKSFLGDINFIFAALPKQKQVIMCSATFSDEAKSTINDYVRKAQHICPDANNVLLGVEQKITVVTSHSNILKQTKHRYEELKRILSQYQFKQCLIFCNFQVRVVELHKMLTRDKWPAEQLYGQQEQIERLDVLKTLQEYKCRILISTDLAARGIDASNVDLVINFEPPNDWQNYLHRIGRAGRFGSYATSITILSDGKEVNKFKQMLAQTKNTFKMVHCWDDKEFPLENIPSESQNEHSDIGHDLDKVKVGNVNDSSNEGNLWRSLVNDPPEENDNISNENIFDFHTLYKSFNEILTPEIESFSELLNSFNNDKNHEMITSHYKPKQIIKLSIPNAVKENYILGDNEREAKESNEDTHVKGDCVSGDVIESDVPKCTDKNVTIKNSKITESKELEYKDGIKNDLKNKRLQNNVTERILNDFEQALSNAGLPTAFGKKKVQKEYGNTSFTKNKSKIKDKYIIGENNVQNSLHNDYHTNKKGNLTSDRESSSADECNPESEVSCSSKITAPNTCKNSLFRKRHTHRESFDAWYHRLQAQTRYIQQVYYYKELNKLYK